MNFKTRGFFIFIILGMSLCFIDCKKAVEDIPREMLPEEEEPPAIVYSLPTAESVQAVSLAPGIWSNRSMDLSENESWTYSISVPDNINRRPVPLVIALHGESGDAKSSEDFLNCLVVPALKSMKAILFAPAGGKWWEELDRERVIELVRLAKLHWPIDTSKVVVTGHSNGGTGSLYMAKNHPEAFSAAIPMAADYQEPTCPVIPTYMIHSAEDEVYSTTILKRIVDGLSAQSCDIQLHLVEDISHPEACKMVLELAKSGNWLRDVVWEE